MFKIGLIHSAVMTVLARTLRDPMRVEEGSPTELTMLVKDQSSPHPQLVKNKHLSVCLRKTFLNPSKNLKYFSGIVEALRVEQTVAFPTFLAIPPFPTGSYCITRNWPERKAWRLQFFPKRSNNKYPGQQIIHCGSDRSRTHGITQLYYGQNLFN